MRVPSSLLARASALLALAGLACARQEPAQGIRIHTDALLVPHIFAETDAGVFRGLGFTQVRDFPVATLANLWSATGRFAEVAGESVLARDERMRQWGIDLRAQAMARDASELEPEVKAWLEAYVAGVNAGRALWLTTPGLIDRLVGAERALGFDPVPNWLHPLRTQEDARARLQRLFEAEVGLEHVLTFGIALAAGPEFGGGGAAARTNVWMMRGGEQDPRTRMLADVHQPLQEFGYRPYFVQLAGPRYDAVGLTAPGFPCIVLGANRGVAFASMTLPGKPRELKAANLPFRLEERAPLVQSSWSGRLAADAPARLVRGEGERAETLALVERSVTLRHWDLAEKALVEDPRGARTLRWLADPTLGLELPVLEPAPEAPLDLAAQPVVRFEARAFLGQRSLWEGWMQLGTSARAWQEEGTALRALGRDGIAMGRGQACLFGDALGDFAFLWSTRTARVTETGRARMGTPLDGHDPEQRWLGFGGVRDVARLTGHGRVQGPTSAWILCNSSKEHLVPVQGYKREEPSELTDGEPWKSLRQDRARELFERIDADGVHSDAELESMALDVQDQWSRANWPWIAALAAGAEPALSERARAFVAWLDRYRFERSDGKPGAAEPFLAHPASQVMPFLVLVRDRSEDALVAERAGPDALALAFDPLFPAPTAEAFLGEERFAANRRALGAALEWAAELRARTLAGEPGGLVNARWLATLAERWKAGGALFPHAFEALLPRTQPAEWGDGAAPVALRWGEMNVYTLTPHRWPTEPLLTNPRLVDGWLDSMFSPRTLEPALPFFRAQSVVAFPSGGTHDSLFQVHRAGSNSYARSLLPRGADWLALAPIDFGSQVLFLAELEAGARPRVRVLPALGATEITVALPELGLEALAPFRVTERFARGEWSSLETDEERLRAAPGVRSFVLAE